MDIAKHIAYWRNGSDEDWEVALDLIRRDKIRHGLFFLHLSMEKLIKAHVCRHTAEVPPKTHNLLRLAETADLAPNLERQKLLVELNDYCMEGRYPDDLAQLPSREETADIVQRTLREGGQDMAAQSVVGVVGNYLRVLQQEEGVPVEFGVLYGSHARGDADEWSDIDVMVVSPLFDQEKRRADITRLWHAVLKADNRIEPVGVGLRQWETDDGIPLIEIARREGRIIHPVRGDSGRVEEIRREDRDVLGNPVTKES
jgi:predicted nucleotidyltransferase/HEPN domain-containing protein